MYFILLFKNFKKPKIAIKIDSEYHGQLATNDIPEHSTTSSSLLGSLLWDECNT